MFLDLTNQALTATIVIVSASILLYNLTRNLRSPVAFSSSILLACVTVAYLVDLFTSLNPTTASLQAWLRVQWIGIAFAPAAMFHLSDALLATTGLISRGRRRRIVRMLYIFSVLFLILVAFSDTLAYSLVREPAPHLLPGPIFPLFVTFVALATVVSVYNVLRARRRCRTTYTHRRMGYLLFSFVTPALGIFPYSLLFVDSGSGDSNLLFWLTVNLGNLGIAVMLLFMAYPLSFFGSQIPDRVVKSELLQFFLRGPLAGTLVLLVILYLPQAGRILGLPSDEFMPLAAVAVVMFWQWMVSLFLPFLERILVYPDEQDQMRMIQSISQRLVTHNDLAQLLESILAAICDHLQAPVAFVAVFEGDQARVEQVVGDWSPAKNWPGPAELKQLLKAGAEAPEALGRWESFWLIPLYGQPNGDNHANGSLPNRLLGVLGIQMHDPLQDLSDEERRGLNLLVEQAEGALDDRRLQTEIFAALEGLLPEMEAIQHLRDTARYGDLPALLQSQQAAEVGTPGFTEAVRNALRDYWGGPRLTDSLLTQLTVVQDALPENDNNPVRALRAVLQDAIDRLRPEGERSMTRAEWVLYNILELRFIQGYKVRDVARRLAMSEADLYRKQRVAVEQAARTLADMEQIRLQQSKQTKPVSRAYAGRETDRV